MQLWDPLRFAAIPGVYGGFAWLKWSLVVANLGLESGKLSVF